MMCAPPLSASEISFVSFSYPKMSFSRKRIKTGPKVVLFDSFFFEGKDEKKKRRRCLVELAFLMPVLLAPLEGNKMCVYKIHTAKKPESKKLSEMEATSTFCCV